MKAIYGELDRVDTFVGMICEPHPPGSEFGELQHAIWQQRFEALRDGDRFFHAWNPALRDISRDRETGTLTWRRTLAELIIDNTELGADDVRAEMFLSAD